MSAAVKELHSYRKYWASRFGTAPFLPMSRAEMDELGWDSCDVIIVTGDAYVDHPSFGMAIMGRLLEAQGFRVGIIAQPDWQSAEPFKQLGRPNLFFGITAGNMDSMVNRYTSDKRIRSDDAYTPGGQGGKRPDRSVVVYAQRAREAFKDVPVVIGGIEASLRRIAHFDYWSEKIRRSVLLDAKADLLVFGNAERQICEIAHRLAAGETIADIDDLRGTAFVRRKPADGFIEIDSTHIDTPGRLNPPIDPYAMEPEIRKANEEAAAVEAGEAPPKASEVVVKFARRVKSEDRGRSVIRMPSFETVTADPVLYAHASRILHLEANPGNARALVQRHGDLDVWLNPPPVPLTTRDMDFVYELPYARRPHPSYGNAEIPAYKMIKFSDRDPARMLWWLHVLQHYRARGPHHPESQRSQRAARDREDPRRRCQASPASSAISAAPPPTCIASRASRRRSRAPAASRAACTPASARTSTPTTAR
jgi:uncharacterized radical SAM protein YgiQ